MKKIDNGREYRSMNLEARELENVEKSYAVEGYATTFEEPYHLYNFEDERGTHEVREVVDINAFEGADMSDVIFQFDHEGAVYARLSNGTMELENDLHGLKVRAFLGGTARGRELYEEINGGYITKMSFGFTVADDNIEREADGNYVRRILKVGKLFDVSAVSYPQNNFTEISARNHCDGVIAEIEAERLRAEEEARVEQEKRESLLARLNALKGESNGN